MRIKPLSGVHLVSQTTNSVVFRGQRGESFRVEVLENDIVRVRHLPDGAYRLDKTWMIVAPDGDMPREGRSRDDNSSFSLPPTQVAQRDDDVLLHTQMLTVHIHLNHASPSLSWHTPDGQMFAQDMPLRAYEYDHVGTRISHVMHLDTSALFYGFGEKAGPLDKRGLRMEMRNLDTLGYSALSSDPLYKHFPFYITFLPDKNIAYGLFYDNFATTVFDMGKEIDAVWGRTRRYNALDGDIDYYMIYGPTIADVIEKYTRLIGRPFLPPRYTLGYMGSTMSYTESPNAQHQLRQFAELTQKHDIPCDLFHLSSGYTTDENNKRCVFTWNRDKVPDPHAMVDVFHAANIKLAANVKPYLLSVNPHYDTLAGQNAFLCDADHSETPAMGMFWSGDAFEHDTGSYIDFTNPVGYDWWQSQLAHELFRYGIDVIWNDNNEFEVWDDDTRCDGFGEPTRMGLMRPIQTLLMNHASYYATQAHRPNHRPFSLSRSGLPGIQRYAQSWSGDNYTSWETLKYNIPMGLGMGLSGAPNTGHDVGGFYGDKPDPELFVRWVQNGIFHPRFTIHSWNTDGTVNEPWMYPEITDLVRDAIHFRYRLIPYLYTLFFDAHETGQPIIRPMVYAFADDDKTHKNSFDFMLGPALLVPSVLEPQSVTTTRSVYFPSGVNWYDFYTGDIWQGGQSVDFDVPLSKFLLFAQEGTLVPMQGDVDRPLDTAMRTVYVFPYAQAGESVQRLIEDDGITTDYERGVYTQIDFQLRCTLERVSLGLHPAHSGYPLPYTQIRVMFPPTEQRQILIDGEVVTLTKDISGFLFVDVTLSTAFG